MDGCDGLCVTELTTKNHEVVRLFFKGQMKHVRALADCPPLPPPPPAQKQEKSRISLRGALNKENLKPTYIWQKITYFC
jgi:hypothetical protein